MLLVVFHITTISCQSGHQGKQTRHKSNVTVCLAICCLWPAKLCSTMCSHLYQIGSVARFKTWSFGPSPHVKYYFPKFKFKLISINTKNSSWYIIYIIAKIARGQLACIINNRATPNCFDSWSTCRHIWLNTNIYYISWHMLLWYYIYVYCLMYMEFFKTISFLRIPMYGEAIAFFYNRWTKQTELVIIRLSY